MSGGDFRPSPALCAGQREYQVRFELVVLAYEKVLNSRCN